MYPGVPKPGKDGDIYPRIIWLHPPNNLIMVYICILPPNNLTLACIWITLSWSATLEFGEKNFQFWWRPFFLNFTWIRGKKLFQFWWRPFFWSSLNLLTWKNRGRCTSLPMLKIQQNWGKIANYPPNAQQRSASLYIPPRGPCSLNSNSIICSMSISSS